MANYLRGAFSIIWSMVNNAVGANWRGLNCLRNIAKKSNTGAIQLIPIKDVLYLGFGDKKLNPILGEYLNFMVNYASKWIYTLKCNAYDPIMVVVYNQTSKPYDVEGSVVQTDGTLGCGFGRKHEGKQSSLFVKHCRAMSKLTPCLQ